jgi:hypothetical protein
MHLLVNQLSKARLESSPGRGDYTSHIVRMHNLAGEVCVSFFLMWPEGAPRGKYADGQVAAFLALEKKYGPEVNFVL